MTQLPGSIQLSHKPILVQGADLSDTRFELIESTPTPEQGKIDWISQLRAEAAKKKAGFALGWFVRNTDDGGYEYEVVELKTRREKTLYHQTDGAHDAVLLKHKLENEVWLAAQKLRNEERKWNQNRRIALGSAGLTLAAAGAAGALWWHHLELVNDYATLGPLRPPEDYDEAWDRANSSLVPAIATSVLTGIAAGFAVGFYTSW